MLGITVAVLFWMTAAFIRPVPTETYEHYTADNNVPVLETTAEVGFVIDEQLDASASVK